MENTETSIALTTPPDELQAANPAEKPRLLSSTLVIFMVAMVLANITTEMYSSLLPLYLKSLNASVLQVGLFFTLAQILPLALQILGGWVSDQFGRLRSMAVGSIIGLFGFIGVVLAPLWQWVLACEGLLAMTRALIGPSFGAFIAEETDEKNRARVFGITDFIYASVSVIGPPLGGWLADTLGFKAMLAVAASIYLIATIIRVSLSRKHKTPTAAENETEEKFSFKSLKKSLGTIFGLIIAGGVLTWLLVTDGARDIAFSMSFQLMPLYLQDQAHISMTQIGFLSSIFGICNMLITMPAGWLSDKVGERVPIVIGFLLEFTALVVFLNVNSFGGYAVVWALFGIGVGLMSPAYQSLLSKILPKKVRGTGFGLINSSLGLFSLPAPWIGAKLWTSYNPRLPFIITAAVTLISTVPVWFKFKLPKKPTEEIGESHQDQ